MTEHLYTPKDVKKVRDQFVKDQNGIDPILKAPFPEPACLDHDHESQRVRAALSRNVNAFEGKVVNAYIRCLKWLTKEPLPVILRNLAEYLEQDYSNNPLHPAWIKRLQIDFNKLKESQKDEVLISLGLPKGTNGVERKTIFKKYLLSKQGDFHAIQQLIKGESS